MVAPALDTLGMFDATAGLPEQVEQAVLGTGRLPGLPTREAVENVVVLGMGGSGVAGDLVLAVAAPFMAIPPKPPRCRPRLAGSAGGARAAAG